MLTFDRDIRTLITDRLPRGKRPVMTHCPNPAHDDSTPSYAVYPDGGKCFGCGFYESAMEVITRLNATVRDIPLFDAHAVIEEEVRKGRDADYPAKVRLWSRVLRTYREDRIQYLSEQRYLSEKTIETYQIGHTGSHFSFPIWDEQRELVGYKLRLDPLYSDPLIRKPAKYINAPGMENTIFRAGSGIDGASYILCEGELDAILLAQYGHEAITTTSGVESILKPHVINYIVHRGDHVVINLDNDEAGARVTEELTYALIDRDFNNYSFWKLGDVGEAIQNGREDEITWETL